MLLEIQNLHANVEGREILRGIDLKVNPGEVHAIMGPNGSGKSTLAQVLAGRDAYDVTEGKVLLDGKDLLEMAPEERAREGVFLERRLCILLGFENLVATRVAILEREGFARLWIDNRRVADGLN